MKSNFSLLLVLLMSCLKSHFLLVYISLSFVVSLVSFSFDVFLVNFHVCCEVGAWFHSHVNIQLSLLPWFKRLVLPQPVVLKPFVKNQLAVIVKTYFWTLNSIPFDLYYVYPYASFLEIRKCGSSSSVVCFRLFWLFQHTTDFSDMLVAWSLAFLLPWETPCWEPGWSAGLGWKSLPSLPFRRHSASRDWAALAGAVVVQGKVIKKELRKLHLAPQAGGLSPSNPHSPHPSSLPHLSSPGGAGVWMVIPPSRFTSRQHTSSPLKLQPFLALF